MNIKRGLLFICNSLTIVELRRDYEYKTWVGAIRVLNS